MFIKITLDDVLKIRSIKLLKKSLIIIITNKAEVLIVKEEIEKLSEYDLYIKKKKKYNPKYKKIKNMWEKRMIYNNRVFYYKEFIDEKDLIKNQLIVLKRKKKWFVLENPYENKRFFMNECVIIKMYCSDLAYIWDNIMGVSENTMVNIELFNKKVDISLKVYKLKEIFNSLLYKDEGRGSSDVYYAKEKYTMVYEMFSSRDDSKYEKQQNRLCDDEEIQIWD